MIFDRTLQYSLAQAIIATAASTNVIDHGALGTVYGAAAPLKRDLGIGADLPLLVQVVEAFGDLTSLKIALQGSVDEAFTSPIELQSQTLLLADLKVGAQLKLDTIPRGAVFRYTRIYYTVTGTAPTAGKVTAGIVAAVQPDMAGPY